MKKFEEILDLLGLFFLMWMVSFGIAVCFNLSKSMCHIDRCAAHFYCADTRK